MGTNSVIAAKIKGAYKLGQFFKFDGGDNEEIITKLFEKYGEQDICTALEKLEWLTTTDTEEYAKSLGVQYEKEKEIVLNKIQQIFGMDPEYNKKMEEQARQLHKKALAGKWCCTCEYCIPVDPNLPGFVTAFPECEYGGMAVETCSRYRVAGTAIRNSAWADQIRERFMRVV